MTSNGKSTHQHAFGKGAFAKQHSIPPVLHQAPIPMMSAGPRCEVMVVTPEIAAKWLAKNVRNRSLRKNRVKAFARDMSAGAWVFNPQPISFGTDDTLLDGQHRLSAIVVAGVAVEMAVWFGVPLSARAGMDLVEPRGLRDIAEISTLKAAISSAMMRGNTKSVLAATMAERTAFYRRFSTEIDLVFTIYRSCRVGLRQASVYAGICRAMFHVPLEDLESFCRVLESGMPNGEARDATVIRLRDRLMQPARMSGAGQSSESYSLTTSAIKAYAEGRALSKIYASALDLFPLPTERVE